MSEMSEMATTAEHVTVDSLREDIARLLGVAAEEVDPAVPLQDQGLDSLRLITIVEQWRAAGVPGLDFPALLAAPTIEAWVELLRPAGDAASEGAAAGDAASAPASGDDVR